MTALGSLTHHFHFLNRKSSSSWVNMKIPCSIRPVHHSGCDSAYASAKVDPLGTRNGTKFEMSLVWGALRTPKSKPVLETQLLPQCLDISDQRPCRVVPRIICPSLRSFVHDGWLNLVRPRTHGSLFLASFWASGQEYDPVDLGIKIDSIAVFRSHTGSTMPVV